MHIPKNVSVPVQLDQHERAGAPTANGAEPAGSLRQLAPAPPPPSTPLGLSSGQLAPIRTAYINQQEFDQLFQFRPLPKFAWSPLAVLRRHFQCCHSAQHFLRFVLSFVPILQWLPNYAWRDNLSGDFMAGITVGVVHVPQGIAYAILSGLDPVHGLYTAFFAVLLYMLFGTSKHVSIGSFAILSLMTGISCRDIAARLDREFLEAEVRLLETGGDLSALRNRSALIQRMDVDSSELVQAITLTAGLIQIAMAVFRVEFLASYLSDQLVNGFCTGAAVHVVVIQLGKLVELDPGKTGGGPGHLYTILQNLALQLTQINVTALVLSLCAFVFLYLGKDVLSARLRRLVPIALPIELILIALMTGASALANFSGQFNITVLNHVPTGLPIARLPRVELLPYVFGDALEIAFVAVALHLSMCKVFNRQMGTKTDNNLELYALGLVGSLSSFFTTFPVSSALGRSMLNVECGAQTQLSSLFSALLLLVVILFVGPLLSTLPMCILAVIIIYSMKNAFQRCPREFVHLWRVSKIDFLIWVVTIVATVVLNVMQGLALAVTFALLTTVFRIQWPRWHLLSNLTGTENYRDSGRYGRVTPLGHGIRIFRFDAPLLFTNVEHFAKSAHKAITMPLPGGAQSDTPRAKCADVECNGNGHLLMNAGDGHKLKRSRTSEGGTVKSLIVDCTGFTFVDYTSINALADLYHQLNERKVNVLFAGAKAPVRDMLELCEFHNSVPKDQFYPNIHDAVLAASHRRKWQRRKRGGFSELSLKRVAAGLLAADNSELLTVSDCNSLCVGENELFQWSFKQTASDMHIAIEEEEEECFPVEEATDEEAGIIHMNQCFQA